jgi:hypothetical protein
MPALMLEISYGSSYNFLSIDNHWVPDGNGGWKAEGFPQDRRPSSPSENIPLVLKLTPFVLPVLLIALYLLSPLSQFIEKEADYKATKYNPEEYRPAFVEKMPELDDEEQNSTKSSA